MNTRLAFVRVDPDRRFVADRIRVSKALLAAVVIAAAVAAVGGGAPAPATGTATGQERVVGEFTGKFVNGIPVYRLAPISVTASRTAELARIEREERLARAAATRARTAARPPA